MVYARGASTALTLGYIVILARELGPDGRGLTAAIFALGAILPGVFGLGLPLAVRRQTKVGKSNQAFSAAVKAIAFTAPASILTGLLVGLSFRPVLTTFEFLTATIFFCSTPFFIAGRVLQQILVGREQYLRQAISQLSLTFGIFTSVIASYLVAEITVLTALLAQIIGMAVFICTGFLLARPSWAGAASRKLLQEARGYWVRDFLRELRNRADQVLVLPLFGAANAGLYSVALVFATLPLVFAQAFGVMAFHRADERGKFFSRRFTSHMKAGLILVVGASIFVSLAAPRGVPIIFGESFRDGVTLSILMALIFTPLMSAFTITENVLNSLGQEKKIAIGELIALSIGITGSVALSSWAGLSGVALSFAAGCAVTTWWWIKGFALKRVDWMPNRGDFAVLLSLFHMPR